MSTPTIDNRWQTPTRHLVPAGVRCAYGARWIDRRTRAEVLPDRQGLLRSPADPNAELELLDALNRYRPADSHFVRDLIAGCTHDERLVGLTHELHVLATRSGGYIYVDAWLTAHEPAVVVDADADPHGAAAQARQVLRQVLHLLSPRSLPDTPDGKVRAAEALAHRYVDAWDLPVAGQLSTAGPGQRVMAFCDCCGAVAVPAGDGTLVIRHSPHCPERLAGVVDDEEATSDV